MASTWDLDRTPEGVAVRGEVDLACAETFGEQLSAAVSEATGERFLIDLSGVYFMDSAGLRALLAALQLGSGKTLIVQTSRQVFTLLDLAGLTNGSLSNVDLRAPRGLPPA